MDRIPEGQSPVIARDTRQDVVRVESFDGGASTHARLALAQCLRMTEGAKTPEQMVTVNRIASQYGSSVATWTSLGIAIDGIQTEEQVTTWLNSLPGKTLENLATYGEIRLKFIPPVKTLELPGAICRHKYAREMWNDIGTNEWEFGLTVDTGDISLDPEICYVNGINEKNGTRKNVEMVDLYEKKYQAEGLDLMPQKAYVPSLVDARTQGIMFDCKSCTLFKLPEEGTDRLPRGEIDLSWSYAGGSDRDLRCRPWLQGKI